jgi:hypothetical protein
MAGVYITNPTFTTQTQEETPVSGAVYGLVVLYTQAHTAGTVFNEPFNTTSASLPVGRYEYDVQASAFTTAGVLSAVFVLFSNSLGSISINSATVASAHVGGVEFSPALNNNCSASLTISASGANSSTFSATGSFYQGTAGILRGMFTATTTTSATPTIIVTIRLKQLPSTYL